MSDDFGATTVDREAMVFDEPLTEPAQPGSPAGAPATQATRAVGPGPAWAGTLAAAPAAAAAPAPPPPVVVPAPVSTPTPPAAAPVDPTDFAATNLHQRAHPIAIEAPLDELSEHNRILAALPKRRSPDGTVTSGSDLPLILGLVFLVVLVVILVIVLVLGLSGAFLGDA